MPVPYQPKRYVGDVNIGAGGDPVGFCKFAPSLPGGGSRYQLCDGKPASLVNSATLPFLTTGALGGFNDQFNVSVTNNASWPGYIASADKGCWAGGGMQFIVAYTGSSYKLLARPAGSAFGTAGWTACTGLPAGFTPDPNYEGVVYAFGKWWIAPFAGTGTGIMSSTDGYAWSNVGTLAGGSAVAMTYCDGVLWLHGSTAGTSRYTTDGTNWLTPTNEAYPNTGRVGAMVKCGSRYYISGLSANVYYTTNPYTGSWTLLNSFPSNVYNNMAVSGANVLCIFSGSSNFFYFYDSAGALITNKTYSSLFGVNFSSIRVMPTSTGFLFYSFQDTSGPQRIAHVTDPNVTSPPITIYTNPSVNEDFGVMAYDPVSKMLYWPGRSYASNYMYNYSGNCVPIVQPFEGKNAYIKLG